METDQKQLECYNPVVIRKTYEQQWDDILKILYFEEVPVWSEIKRYWRNALEFTVNTIGWIALWKPSRACCSKFSLSYPTAFVVKVENINFDGFTATISVILSDDEIALPLNIPDVPLIHLFPSVIQDRAVIDVQRIADILNDLRVFFNHLWHPWDEINTDSDEGFIQHFENRLKLYYDISMGNIQLLTLAIIENFIKEGNILYKRIKKIEEELTNVNDSTLADVDSVRSDMRFLLLSQLQLKLGHLSLELTFYEDKTNRDLLEQNQLTEEANEKGQFVSLAWTGGSLTEYLAIMKKLHDELLHDKTICFRRSDSLDKVITQSFKKEIIYLAPATYCLKNRTILHDNVIQGFESSMNTVISDSEEGLCLFESRSEEVCINFVELAPSNVKHVLIVYAGVCNLNNVKFTCSGQTEIGIFVHSGAQLVAENCRFHGYSIGVQAAKGSTVILKNCLFDNNENGLEFEESRISIDSCKFNHNKGFALLMLNSIATFLKKKVGQSAFEDFMSNITLTVRKNSDVRNAKKEEGFSLNVLRKAI